MNHPTMFLDGDNKTKLVPASFSCFLELLWEKNKFSLKSVIFITVIISLCIIKNLIKLFYLLALAKK